MVESMNQDEVAVMMIRKMIHGESVQNIHDAIYQELSMWDIKRLLEDLHQSNDWRIEYEMKKGR